MRQKKIEIGKMIKKYPILAGFALIVLVMCLVLVIKMYEKRSAIEPTVVTEAMARPATVDGFTAGEDTVRYLISAVREDDLDKAMRAFPVDEMVLGADSAKIIDMEEQFSSEFNPPSSIFGQYVPAASSEIAGQYAAEMASLENALEWEKAEILDVRILLPEEQMTGQYQREMLELSECWGADVMCEMLAEIRCGEELYMFPVTVAKYGESWKVFRLEAAVSGNVQSGLAGTDEEIYESLTDPEVEEEVWETLGEEEELQYTDDPEQQMLPPNYFLAGQAYSQSPEDVITQFSKYIEKEDITSALCFGYLGHEQLESDQVSVMNRQKEFAKQIVEMYCGLLFEEKTRDPQPLEDLGMTGEEIVGKLNPENIPYMDLKKIIHLGENEYAAVYVYGREYYLTGFTMCENENGWQIKSLTSALAGLEDGGVRKITESEYERLEVE